MRRAETVVLNGTVVLHEAAFALDQMPSGTAYKASAPESALHSDGGVPRKTSSRN